MALRLIRGATFRVLERRLVHDLCGQGDSVPGLPVWVVVPTAGVANHLRLQILRSAGSKVLAGIRVAPLNQFLERLSTAAGVAPGERRGPRLDLLLHYLCQQSPELEIARSMAQIRSGSRFLMPTFRDLGDGGFGHCQSELLIEIARQPELATVESEVLYLYCRWLKLLKRADVDWAPLQAQRLAQELEDLADGKIRRALAGEPDRCPQVFFHGFYEFTDVNTQLLAALSRRLPTRLYFPFLANFQAKGCHPAFAFVMPILEDLQFRLGASLEEIEDLGKLPPDEPGQYFLRHFPEGDPSSPPWFLSWQFASGVRAEAISAALRIRRWLDEDESLQPSEILIVAPDALPYLPVLPEVFRDFALPLRISEAPGSPQPAEKMLRSLGRLWEEGAASEWVLSHLRDFPQSGLDLEEFEQQVRAGGIWGPEAWERALRQSEGWSDSQKCRIEHIARALALQGPESRLPPQQALKKLEALERFWLDGSDALRIQRQAIGELAGALPDLTIPEALMRDWLLESGTERPRSDPWNRSGVLFAPLMRSRGLTARRLVVLGLSCGRLPFRIEQDPLLSDRSRRRLAAQARDVGHRLPIKTRATDEQALLFLLLNTSADALHWVIPESDENGRPVAPTPWVQRFLQHWDSDGANPPGGLEPLPCGPRQQAFQMLAADAGTGRFLPPRPARLLGFRLPSDEAAPDRMGPRLTIRLPSLSVTALEILARCPFRFLARFLAGWTPLEPLHPFRQPSDQQRGQLLHRALEHLLAEPVEQGASLPATARMLLRDGGEQLRKGVRQAVEEALSARSFPHRLLQEAAVASLTRTLSDYFQQAAGEQAVYPVSLEADYRKTASELGGAQVSGKIDRVDQGDFQLCQVIDYKSGKTPAQLDAEVRAGFRLQPALYPWLHQPRPSGSGGAEASFAYIFLGDEPPRTRPFNEAPPACEVLLSLASLLGEGCFFPTSNQAWQRLGLQSLQPCRGCRLASLCRRHDPGAAERSERLFEEKAQPRLQYLRKHLS
ncbi:MAG: PD-(D/E)XK nuclease family protein [Acidobacteriota bacterium]